MQDAPPVEVLNTGHQSGRFDARPLQRRGMMHQLTETSRAWVLTEAVGENMPDGYRSVGHETRVGYGVGRWHLADDGVESLRTGPWKRGTSRRRSVDITWGLLEDKSTTATLLRFGGHLPAHLDDPDQEAANETALLAMGPLIRELIAEFAPDKSIGSLDFNRELTLARNRKLIERAMRGTGLDLIVPPKPTHHGRTIDGFLANAGDVTMLRPKPGYDHRGAVLHTRIRTHRQEPDQP